jgi:hypothetical protein
LAHGLQLPCLRPRPGVSAPARPARLAASQPPGLFVLDAVDQLDLGPFLKAYRADSSRQIERRYQEDIAFRILAGNSTPIM